MVDTSFTHIAHSTQTIQQRYLHVITWGCQMNVYDSNRMVDLLRPLGYKVTDEAEKADVLILNTCHIRDKATEKVFSELGRLRQIKEYREDQGNPTLIAVAGCVAQAEGEIILKRAPYVDIVFGPQTYHRLPKMILDVARKSGNVIETDFPTESKFDFLPAPDESQGYTAFLTIQEGCDKFCSFCVVPYTRGAEESRPVQAIVDEATHLCSLGVKEISLLGQNVNAYHGQGPDGNIWDLVKLAEKLSTIPGLLRIRYTTSHPNDMSDSLIAAHRDLPTLMPFLHLPVQSGSDRILKSMNRGHTVSEYYAIIEKLKKARPDIALSSDFIIGHPGETNEDFKATMKLVQDITFAQAFSFKYSPRPGTSAAVSMNQIAEPEKDARLQELQAVLKDQQTQFNKDTVGRKIPILFTHKGRKEGQIAGKSPYLQAVHAQGNDSLIGQECMVEIDECLTFSLSGSLVKESTSH
ncbi:tRNA A37 methylthiotransferase MiaB (MiaB) (PDB:4JC0) (PUBMED:17407324 [Commensalibacter communis]|uniref:tRNA-2-methylthio-N(6)-dimethylallyladenosine synthase n=1 Tax=Commensalibacter communis TaxID=2972786 RepID=A0A9W4XH40_9PROT|nr:tRNA (N6-isopentenyl adenosine(37)-C2)-methylthiotransferase MiaB [Commensalibacter communis]CAI3924882.1 tRNA A37 methylthiotransferase MiaB (MiaB) (PDB:4JC0) (PUBMED:17407324 [Commensalibacter communis]CAI3924889.1 tRNA A37 methylthiotransferase MiaB (MiaB) (PDB:4JC0) (PUBMED:17407324 [Commensalibacter communis]CAI3928435.1 tRNA A37 methylthiotransferase MiaB (MiaB) (PDB:4JC0) (PUBMED:17407324 [Commensalibacter communis]CAI3929782.1 tRNA A37 methylthiotransferase MiaB (MiaB) (PDB:4JC0) (PU